MLLNFVIQPKIQILDYEYVLLDSPEHSEVVLSFGSGLLAAQQVFCFVIWIDDACQIDIANLLVISVFDVHLLRLIFLFLEVEYLYQKSFLVNQFQ